MIQKVLAVLFMCLCSGLLAQCSSYKVDGVGDPMSSIGNEQNPQPKITDVTYSTQHVSFTFSIPHPCRVQIDAHNATGYIVRKLVDDNYDAGVHSVEWDSVNDAGKHVETGIYLICLQACGFSECMLAPLCVGDDNCGDLYD